MTRPEFSDRVRGSLFVIGGLIAFLGLMVLGLERRSMGLILLAIATAIAPLIIAAARKNPSPVPFPSSWKEPDDERERRDRRAFLLIGVLSTLGAAYGFLFTDGSLAGLVSGICLSLVAVFSFLAWQGRRRPGG